MQGWVIDDWTVEPVFTAGFMDGNFVAPPHFSELGERPTFNFSEKVRSYHAPFRFYM